jgi:hypothetical protein
MAAGLTTRITNYRNVRNPCHVPVSNYTWPVGFFIQYRRRETSIGMKSMLFLRHVEIGSKNPGAPHLFFDFTPGGLKEIRFYFGFPIES